MPSRPWTDATDRQLLLSIIHLTGTTLPKWEKVADLMNGACATDGYTAESTRQHFQKMRKECKTKFGEPGTGGATTNGSTPSSKRKAAGEGTPKATGKLKKSRAGAGTDHDDPETSPNKKVKGKIVETDDDAFT
ncbi:hypothetical protein LTR35_004904 [Friedmanniomyces endolithicus]|uniref:Myb-like domain-containing protein n=1 Tax=Friedmanniomyces endolithicus TaxID=329885 RepID=A0AAN6JG46_9PEZI|nr:hypothetical protein LTR35_004904 [Friedmanniomyces endolithicus]KAK0298961.1 hypothetical protein LTS00_002723 [Friedmanniomyces endolithicus]KAK0328953.1 hypothetical protein LTR82_000886 [Friedmanniomyces endolithicus]KAK1003820.1 hypothetical protein LTR54_007584 [Friedmanniomyces endolithicus]